MPTSAAKSNMSGSMERGAGTMTEITHFDESLSYTSLRDLLPTSRPGSPRQGETGEGVEKKEPGDDRPAIKNRLVERAARAYLRPVSDGLRHSPEQMQLGRYWPTLSWEDLARMVQSLFKLKLSTQNHRQRPHYALRIREHVHVHPVVM
uniref:Uncharacterized protein n=1 Tax=Physcomitrium patens TaxID=3218 RepID=A0A2K1J8N6_PHYPA|nr:hypothetical protein PHYPA_021002 [Physcomitrium patens]